MLLVLHRTMNTEFFLHCSMPQISIYHCRTNARYLNGTSSVSIMYSLVKMQLSFDPSFLIPLQGISFLSINEDDRENKLLYLGADTATLRTVRKREWDNPELITSHHDMINKL